MISLLRNRLGIPGVISVIALVFAMSGGAFAAKKFIITSPKQIKPSVLKKLKGPRGKRGKPGPAGLAGPAGEQGLPGANGKDGTNGTNGTNGESVTVTPLGPGECANEEGGAKFTVGAEEAEACNGEEGSPWTAGGTLPKGATLTGAWTLTNADPAYFGVVRSVPIAFPIKLAGKVPPANTHIVTAAMTAGNEVPAACDSNDDGEGVPVEPEADSGHLCFFVVDEFGGPTLAVFNWDFEGGAYPAGTLLIEETGDESFRAFGTYAVTG